MTEEKAIEILEELRDSTLNIAEDYETALQMGINSLKTRIVARDLAADMLRTVRVKENDYE